MAIGGGFPRTCRVSHNFASYPARLQTFREGSGWGQGRGKRGPLPASRIVGVHLMRLEHPCYHHGLFDSPFCREPRNVFFPARLLAGVSPLSRCSNRIFIPCARFSLCNPVHLAFVPHPSIYHCDGPTFTIPTAILNNMHVLLTIK